MGRSNQHYDLVIIGGGIIGIRLAISWKNRHPDTTICILEKETQVGAHSSGRNSGVLHAGFYYTADTFKARYTREGNAALTAYCKEKSLPLRACGKLVVARNETEHAGLDELLRRAKANGVELQNISEEEALEIEPRVRTTGRALWSPTTSTVDPEAVTQHLATDAQELGIDLKTGIAYQGRKGCRLRTREGLIGYGYLVNAAGLQADQVAADFGFGENYRILPFKGVYLYSNQEPGELRTNIYPVPLLSNPFLGVHYTVTVAGKAKIGPTAMPAFWRENYQGLDNFVLEELLQVLSTQLQLFVRAGFDFKGLAWQELKKYHRPHLVKLAGELLHGVREQDYRTWGRPGIRAQLLDLKERKLVMDFLIEGDEESLHVLNAISPAFTCSFPFGEFLCDKIEEFTR
jgi:L-2-hydroxyglutarate oxidase LhgO